MSDIFKSLGETSPSTAVLALAVALVLIWLLIKSLSGAPKEPASFDKAKLADVGGAYGESDDDTITATGVVERTVAVDNANYFHLAVKLDRSLPQLDGGNMLRFSDDYGFIDLPLVKVGDRVKLEFSIDEDMNVELIEFTWLPEQAA